jgi:hypothetical protein
MKQPLQHRSAAPQRHLVLPESEEKLCNAIPALVETTAPGALLDNAAQLLGYATAAVPKQITNLSSLRLTFELRF